ncbi:hypothetical protein [Streptomyces sp. NPDC053431]|uniref:LppU/SCO3897 family protein n=1 Tax=Streptomyces sp. NPDC053431 TaxID=3365703 RepID=UPI0037D2049C
MSHQQPHPYEQPQPQPYQQPQPQSYPQQQPHPYPQQHPQPQQPHLHPQQQQPHPYPQAAQSYAQPQPPYGASAPHGCEVCGAQPAAAATVRAHQGMVVVMRTVTRRGVFCRTCGLAVYRQMTSETLVTGWWGLLSFFVTPFVVLGNLGARSVFRRMPEPYGARRPPLDPGRRVLRRAPAMLILTPVALVLLAIPALVLLGLLVEDEGDGGTVGLSVGDCVHNTEEWPEQKLLKVDCGSPLAEYRVADEQHCGPSDYLLRAEYMIDSPGTPGYCVTAK